MKTSTLNALDPFPFAFLSLRPSQPARCFLFMSNVRVLVHLTVRAETSPGDALVIVGSTPHMGSWDASASQAKMRRVEDRSSNAWRCEFWVSANEELEYKVAIVRAFDAGAGWAVDDFNVQFEDVSRQLILAPDEYADGDFARLSLEFGQPGDVRLRQQQQPKLHRARKAYAKRAVALIAEERKSERLHESCPPCISPRTFLERVVTPAAGAAAHLTAALAAVPRMPPAEPPRERPLDHTKDQHTLDRHLEGVTVNVNTLDRHLDLNLEPRHELMSPSAPREVPTWNMPSRTLSHLTPQPRPVELTAEVTSEEGHADCSPPAGVEWLRARLASARAASAAALNITSARQDARKVAVAAPSPVVYDALTGRRQLPTPPTSSSTGGAQTTTPTRGVMSLGPGSPLPAHYRLRLAPPSRYTPWAPLEAVPTPPATPAPVAAASAQSLVCTPMSAVLSAPPIAPAAPPTAQHTPPPRPIQRPKELTPGPSHARTSRTYVRTLSSPKPIREARVPPAVRRLMLHAHLANMGKTDQTS